jgi:hypothetical protein
VARGEDSAAPKARSATIGMIVVPLLIEVPERERLVYTERERRPGTRTCGGSGAQNFSQQAIQGDSSLDARVLKQSGYGAAEAA